MGIFLSFLPWIAFWILSGNDHYQIASLAATIVVIVLNIKDVVKGRVKILDLGTLIFFVVVTIISFTSNATWIDRYSAPLSDAAMFLIAAFSLMIRKPFTLQYAYERVDKQFWNTPGFYKTNKTISLVWCLAFAVNTILAYVYVQHPLMIDWIIHIAILIAAIKFTAWYPDFRKAKAAEKK